MCQRPSGVLPEGFLEEEPAELALEEGVEVSREGAEVGLVEV